MPNKLNTSHASGNANTLQHSRVKFMICFIVIITVLSPFPVQTQSLLTVEEAVRAGLNNNYAIRIAENEAEILRLNNTLGNAGVYPDVSAEAEQSASITDSRQEYISGDISEKQNAQSQALTAGVSLNWIIFDGMKMFITKEKLNELASRGELQAKTTVENTVKAIILAYYDIVRQQGALQVLNDGMEISRERIEIAQTKLDLGSGSGLELLQARTDFNSDRSAYLRQESILKNAKISLNRLLGREIETAFTVVDRIDIDSTFALGSLLDRLENNARLQQIKTSKVIAQLQLKELQAGRYPRLGLNMRNSYSRSESESGFLLSNESNGLSLGLSASINLFSGFNLHNQIQEATIRVRNSEFRYLDATQELRASLERTFEDYRNSLELVRLERENLDVAQQTVNVAKEKYRLGTITPLELKEAQRAFIQTESRLLDVEYRAKQTETELRRLTGQLLGEE